jgi:hypothetical protein
MVKVKVIKFINFLLNFILQHEDFVGAIQLYSQCENTVLHYKEYQCIRYLNKLLIKFFKVSSSEIFQQNFKTH